MRISTIVDPLAQQLLELRKVSGAQWALRGLGVAGTFAALAASLPEGMGTHVGSVWILLVVLLSVAVQVARPDNDLGLLAPVAIILGLLGLPGLTALHALAVGVLLLVAHAAWAGAALLPAHGTVDASVGRPVARSLLAVLGVGVLLCLPVLALASVDLGPWMILLGAMAVIALLVAVLPMSSARD